MVRYGVIRSNSDPLVCSRPPGGAEACDLPQTGILGRTHKTTFTDDPPAGSWTYRVEVIASVPPPSGDLILLSRPATATVPTR